ncbi:MAG: response regulator [Fibrobacteres bacterium]|jgi:two-component system chemotaxis response regulator CheY|nr:response regulator [Fibrobacterota bacterium]
MKILLVDDSGTMRQIQKMILQGIGLTDVIEAADGSQAIKMAVEQRPALILMDWNMPGMKGIEALRKLKAADVTKAIPVIMVTSESEKSHVLEAVRAGAANYMVKPITAEVVKEKLTPYLIHYGVVPVAGPVAAPSATGKGPDEAPKSGASSEPETKPAPPK